MPDPDQPPAPAAVTPPPAQAPQHGNLITTAEGWLHRAETSPATTRFISAVRDHAGVVFDVAGDAVTILKLINPADAAAVTAAEAFLAKVLTMTESAAQIASAAQATASKAAA